MKYYLTLSFVITSFISKSQIIQECDFDKMHFRFEIQNIVADKVNNRYSFDYTFVMESYDSISKYIAVEVSPKDTFILNRFTGDYFLNRILKFYFGTCDESNLPLSCKLPNQSLSFKKLDYGGRIISKKTVNTEKRVIDILRKSQIEIILAYISTDILSNKLSASDLFSGKYWDFKKDMNRIFLKIDMQNYKEIK